MKKEIKRSGYTITIVLHGNEFRGHVVEDKVVNLGGSVMVSSDSPIYSRTCMFDDSNMEERLSHLESELTKWIDNTVKQIEAEKARKNKLKELGFK
jgi:hypothetical protein